MLRVNVRHFLAICSSEAEACVLQVKIDRPLVRIPMLAIHLQREIVVDGFNPNTQSHITPVLATAIKVLIA